MTKPPRTQKVDAATLRRLAVNADADPRTVAKEIAKPGSVDGMSGQRVRAALVKAGLRKPEPTL